MVSEKPVVILDGAHNPEGVLSLVQTIEEHFPNKEDISSLQYLRDKELKPMLKTLASIESKIYFTQFDSPRITEAEEFLSIYPIPNAKVNSNWRELIENVYMTLTRDEVLIISGSLYFISEVKPYLRTIIKENNYKD